MPKKGVKKTLRVKRRSGIVKKLGKVGIFEKFFQFFG